MKRSSIPQLRIVAVTAALGCAVLAPRGAWATNYTVNTANMGIVADGKCGLAEAIKAINNRAPVPDATHRDCAAGNGQDVISFSTTLNGVPLVATSTLYVGQSVQINGRGVGKTIIRANLALGTELFSVWSPNGATMIVTIQDVTIDKASTQSAPQVTGVYTEKTGIDGDMTLTLTRTRVAGHTWAGVYGDGATMTINDSSIENNSSPDPGGGVAEVANANGIGNLFITHSTINGNTSSQDGGGIYWFSGGNSHVDDSTVSGNTAAGNGGGIAYAPYDQTGYFQIAGSTVAFNHAQVGGGVFSPNSDNKSQAMLSIFANNTSTFFGLGSEWFGEVEFVSQSLVFHADGNLTIQIPDPNDHNLFNADPKLDATLRDLGGNHVKVHNLLTGSPAIDYASGAPQDQTDTRRLPRGVDGDGVPTGLNFDIGGCERQGR